ncbi:MAG: hypothetical protein E7604_11985 [Ruminococcaceae bacterium]|nr:hypothetical protein [Oscillospiraceae bacterium]
MHIVTRFLPVLVLVFLLSAGLLISCGEIYEEEETETETAEIEQDAPDMKEDIDANLELLASAYDAITSAKLEGVNEYDFISANPEAFDAIVAWGMDAVPYLCEIGEGHRMAFTNMRVAPEEYAKCILALAAAQEIDSATFNRAYASPDGVHILYQSPTVLWGMADAFQGVIYDIFLADAQGTVLAAATGFSSLAYIDWTEDGRYAVVSDRLREEDQPAQTTVFDAEQTQIHALPGREVFDGIVAQYGKPYYTIDTRYLSAVSDGVLRIWLGLKMTDGQTITGYYDYDLIAGEITAREYAPFDAETDGAEIARGLPSHEVGTSLAYLMSDTAIFRLEVEVREEWERTLFINGTPALTDYLFLDDFRVIDDRYLAVVTGGTDVNSKHLYLYDGAGTLLFETYYLTDKGMIFDGIKAVEDDRILLYGGRGYHGPSLLMRGQELVLSGAYADFLYCDPIPDVIEGGEVTADAFGEVPLYPDRASIDPDLNPELVMFGVYALPYLGEGQFGQIVPVEATQTLGQLIEMLYP